MNFLIADAVAQQTTGSAGPQGSFLTFLPLVFIFVIFYFMLIRPQQKRTKEHTQMVSSLKKGDEVVTGGGILGRVTDVGENFIQVEVAEGLQLKIQKQSVASLMPKGTFKGEL